MILITTCKTPQHSTRKFARSLSQAIQHSIYTPRGTKNTFKLIELARHKGLLHIAIITQKKAKPSQIRVMRVKQDSWAWLKNLNIAKIDEKQLIMLSKRLSKL